VCLAGTERWQDVGKLLGLRDYQDPQAAPAAVQPEAVVRAKKKGKAVGSSGCVLLIFGLLMLLLFWPVGVILIGAAIIVNYLSVKPTCTACGNVTVSTARQCAVCKAVFVQESQVKNLAMGLFMAVLFLGLIGWVIFYAGEELWEHRQWQERAQIAAQPKPAPVPAPPPAPEDPRLWSLREKVVEYYRTKGYSVQESTRARSVTVKMSAIQGSSLKDYQLENLAMEGLKIWQSEDAGFFTVLITDTTGQYLASADPSATKTLR
jgi:hypothetical protein